jgi:hypothetical protein
MNGIRTDHCAGPRAAAYCWGAGIAMLVSTMAVYAQHPHPTQHPHVTQHPNLICPHGLGHLPGHHAHHCRLGSTPFTYESPSYDDYQHLMPDFETLSHADLGGLPSQVKQIQQIQETVSRETSRIIAYQRELQQQIYAQTSWGTRGAGGNLSGPNANLGGRRSSEPGANAPAQKRLQDEPQDQEALDVRGHEPNQTDRKEQSPRRGPGWRRFVFEDVIRALTR